MNLEGFKIGLDTKDRVDIMVVKDVYKRQVQFKQIIWKNCLLKKSYKTVH